ncbi:MAG: response regulator [Patescibacteria group bacterium]|jgi:DNA-binding response OmpR family regulator
MLEKEKKPKILIIEDDHFLANIYVTIFSQKDFEVLTSGTGEDGWKLIEREQPDVVLLDILLPGPMNGLDVLRKIRRNETSMKIPVIILSNCDDDETISEGLRIGAESYFIKAQTTPDDILHSVMTFLN